MKCHKLAEAWKDPVMAKCSCAQMCESQSRAGFALGTAVPV